MQRVGKGHSQEYQPQEPSQVAQPQGDSRDPGSRRNVLRPSLGICRLCLGIWRLYLGIWRLYLGTYGLCLGCLSSRPGRCLGACRLWGPLIISAGPTQGFKNHGRTDRTGHLGTLPKPPLSGQPMSPHNPHVPRCSSKLSSP